jgi:translocation and assembly module TamB
MRPFRKLLAHPRTQTTRKIVRRTLAVTSVILAVVFILTLTRDIGDRFGLRELAERQGTAYLNGRSMHIGSLSIRVWDGAYVVRDLRIDGLTPQSPPWLVAKEITVHMPDRQSLWNRQIVIDSIEMSDWKMYVEQTADGHSFPKFGKGPSDGPRRWTTTLKYVRSHRGEFTYDDKTTPWSVVARNIDVIVAKPAEEYRGSARFSNGLVTIQDYLPFRAGMDTTFKIAGGRVLFDRINLETDGAKSVLKGDIDMAHWPEQMYSVKSKIDLPRMRQIWFAKDKFELAGTAEFDGYFHLYKGEVRPDGKTSGGREVKGTFRTAGMRVNDYQFDDVAGSVLWNPSQLRVHDATARLYGGTADFEYSMAPLGVRDVKPTNSFDSNYRNVDLTVLSDFFELMGIRLAGRGSGHNLMKWPSGRFRDRTWTGKVTADPPAGTTLMTRNMPLDELKQRAPRNQNPGAFSPHLPKGPVPIGGTVTYSLSPEWIEIGPSQIATPTTYVEIEGRTAYGERSQLPFHVTSSDWQDSDRLFAGMLTAFGSTTKVIPVDGYGTFDGTMFNEFRRPRIEGMFAGEDIRAFDVTWGSVKGDAVIENSYANVTNVMVSSSDGSTMTVDGKFSLGYPRRDGGEQINATIRIDGRPIADLKHAFDIDDYDFSGRMSGDFTVTGAYERPFGSGTMTITEANAYGETFDTVTADVKLEGDNVRLDNIQAKKADGQGSGFASISWKGAYAFNFTGTNIAAEKLTLTQGSRIPFSGVIDFTADGAGTFERPQYSVKGSIRDLFVADEGIGTVFTQFDVDGDLLRFNRINVDTARLSVFGSGKITLNDARDTDLTFNILNSSLDPYIRAFEPRLSPYTTAIVSGSVHIYGELSDIDNVLVDASVDQFDARLFDFVIRNPDDPTVPGRRVPIRFAFARHTVRVVDMQLAGQDTNLNVAGTVDLHNEMIAMRLGGGANLRILEGFTRNVSSRGTAKVDAELSGNMRSPVLSGKMEVNEGRIRHYSLPHALEKIAGVVTFDSKGVNLDELTAQIGGGPVTFGGSIGIEGYRPGRVDVTIVGENMTLRYPESLSPWLVATVDADLTLDGSVDALNLGGQVDVHRAQYTKRFDAGVNFFDFGQGNQTAVGSTFLTPTLPLSYNVRINAPSTITANNNLLQNVVASADVTLVGTFDRPGVTGNIDVDRGDVYFGGRRYQIRTGSTIRFDNPTAIEPFFDIEAVTRIRVPGETYVVTVTNAGPNFSNVTFSSDPSLPDFQLLALLLSDVAPSKDVEFRQYQGITPQEQMLRTELTRILTSTATGEFNRAVQDALAVESFQFSPTLIDPNVQSARLDPGARVTFVKRVGNRIYVTYSRSLSSTTRDQVIVLEIDQTDRVSWILSRNEDGTYALDLRVRRTF